MSLELLANELLVDLFEYLPLIDLFRPFHGLNSRFDTLLLVQFRKHCLDFRSMFKRDFDTICQRYLPLVVDQIITIRLSDDDDETPHQIKYFLSHGLTLRSFTHLESLSLYNLSSSVIMCKLIAGFHKLHHLTHFNLIKCQFENRQIPVGYIANSIWSLPKLTHFHWDEEFLTGYGNKIAPSKISTSLKYLSIKGISYKLTELTRIFENTPSLVYLCVQLEEDSDDQPLTLIVPSLITLRVNLIRWLPLGTNPIGRLPTMTNLLKSTPNLQRLICEAYYYPEINGYQWEEIIVNHLPRLKVFQFLYHYESTEKQADELFDSFQTRFWLDKHQWFVRCDFECYNTSDSEINITITIYTLPFAFDSFTIHYQNFKSKSAWPDDVNYPSYNKVHTLDYCDPPPSKWPLLEFSFSHLYHINLILPFDGNLFSIISRFDRLKSLTLRSYKRKDFDPQCQLQTLLDRTPFLYSLEFDEVLPSSAEVPPFQYSCKSVRRLDLLGSHIEIFYNRQQCAKLSCSPLGIQCEVLKMAVDNRTNIIDLLNTIKNLRVLNVVCEDDTWTRPGKHYLSLENEPYSSTEDELIKWLQNHLPSTDIITRNNNHYYSKAHFFRAFWPIQIWIR